MFRHSMLAVALAVAGVVPAVAQTTDGAELKEIRDQIRRMRDDYEARIRALEQRLQDAERRGQAATAAPAGTGAPLPRSGAVAGSAATPSAAVAAPGRSGTVTTNLFNPAMSLIIGGTYARLSQDPEQYRIQGFVPGSDEIGPGSRNFSLGESELTLSASIDHRFSGQMTVAVTQENEVELEEAFVRAHGLGGGINLKAGRFLSGVGYMNAQHAHSWDFVDAPLAYQAFFGGHYRNDGVQLTWLAPTETFVEVGVETGRGGSFPGSARNKNGLVSSAAFVRVGGDIGVSTSWRAGLSWVRDRAVDRQFDDTDAAGASVTNAFTGRSTTWIADAVLKWAPNGNATQRNLKLQAEYFRRKESGALTYDVAAQSLGTIDSAYRAAQSGYYVQGVYQFMPQWRFGLRYDRLNSGTPGISAIDDGLLSAADFSRLLAYNPSRQTAMIDWSPSEFSRLRLQVARDRSRPEVTDNQLFIQYIMSLGVHGAHAF